MSYTRTTNDDIEQIKGYDKLQKLLTAKRSQLGEQNFRIFMAGFELGLHEMRTLAAEQADQDAGQAANRIRGLWPLAGASPS
jgi:hypothetical protein